MNQHETRKPAMTRMYTWAARPVVRSVTIAALQEQKGTRKWTQVKANTAEEAAAAAEAGLDMILCRSTNTEAVRKGDNTLFLTAGIVNTDFQTKDDILREAFRKLSLGADAIMTSRSMDVVEMLAREDIPVMGHLGLVPRKSTWTNGLRAVGRTADEALELYRSFKRLESAGGVLVEAEVIPGPVLAEISKRTKIITISLGSGPSGDVDYLFMEDICGEEDDRPRHARAFGNLRRLREEIRTERITALTAFRKAAEQGDFPAASETPSVQEKELEEFIAKLENEPR
jgi:3-methyl-2-oxobutanoate hydroxymethyltransferase